MPEEAPTGECGPAGGVAPDAELSATELIGLLADRWGENFADAMASRICAAKAVGELYRLVTGTPEALPRPLRHKILFRGAYVLERIYFRNREAFAPWMADFCRAAFPACTDPSARRHFGKIMADLLGRLRPDRETLERIAGTAADWVVDPAAKVAVRVWAMEVLKRCRDRVAWVDECWDDLVETQRAGASPGIVCRMRNSWR